MSRLIDADALQQHFADMQKYERCACNFVDEGGYPATEWYCVEGALENAPTIDAIPVEWIMKWSNKRYRETQRDVSIVDVLEAWQKEQEAKQCEIHD